MASSLLGDQPLLILTRLETRTDAVQTALLEVRLVDV